MKYLSTIVILISAYTLIYGKSTGADCTYIDDINEILLMGKTVEKRQIRPDLTPIKKDAEDCICLPAYLCKNNLPINEKPCTDNTCTTSVRMRMNDGSCGNGMVRCCRDGTDSAAMTPAATPKTTNKDRPDLTPINTLTLSCPCVSPHQCEYGIPCTDGCDAIDPKINDGTCSDPTLVPCCNAVNNGAVATPIRPNLTPVNTTTLSCPCLPSYQCENGTPCTDGCEAINAKINDGTCSDPTHVPCCNTVLLTQIKPNLTPKVEKSSCSCIPYDQCYNETQCTDGCDVVDVRINDGICSDPSHVRCCKGVNSTLTPMMISDSNTADLTSKNQLPSCPCIDHYNCYNGTPCTDGCGVINIRINHNSCKLPNVLCCKENNTSLHNINVSSTRNNVKTTSTSGAPKRRGCGVQNPNGIGFRIVDSKTNLAKFGEFPWMVAILFEDKNPTDPQEYYPEQALLKYQCGGSLIHPQVVLTSTHCVVSKEKIFHVRVGEWDIKSTEEIYPHQERVVEKVITHPEFYSGGLYNDIALLILETPVNITKNVDTVCLPAQDEILKDIRCYTSGWGKNVFQMNEQYETTLKKVQLPIVQKDLCQNQLRTARSQDDFILHESFVCAGGEKDKDACKGDGGSSLACPFSNDPKRYFQAGIVSWGIGCGLENVPGLYVNVARFRNWVDEHMIKLGYDTSYYIY